MKVAVGQRGWGGHSAAPSLGETVLDPQRVKADDGRQNGPGRSSGPSVVLAQDLGRIGGVCADAQPTQSQQPAQTQATSYAGQNHPRQPKLAQIAAHMKAFGSSSER